MLEPQERSNLIRRALDGEPLPLSREVVAQLASVIDALAFTLEQVPAGDPREYYAHTTARQLRADFLESMALYLRSLPDQSYLSIIRHEWTGAMLTSILDIQAIPNLRLDNDNDW